MKEKYIDANEKCLPFSYHIDITHSGSLGDEFSGWICIPIVDSKGQRTQRVLYTLTPVGAGSGRVEWTNASEKQVNDDPSSADLDVVSWPSGNVTAQTYDDSVPFTAFRVAIQSGRMRLRVRVV